MLGALKDFCDVFNVQVFGLRMEEVIVEFLWCSRGHCRVAPCVDDVEELLLQREHLLIRQFDDGPGRFFIRMVFQVFDYFLLCEKNNRRFFDVLFQELGISIFEALPEEDRAVFLTMAANDKKESAAKVFESLQ